MPPKRATELGHREDVTLQTRIAHVLQLHCAVGDAVALGALGFIACATRSLSASSKGDPGPTNSPPLQEHPGSLPDVFLIISSSPHQLPVGTVSYPSSVARGSCRRNVGFGPPSPLVS